uniref:Uncharacterized protein n=1 Tax=Manihot esculenta TaxID=3983 RepID=A0A2C9UUN3_MANES
MMSKIRGRLGLYFSRLGLFLPTHFLLYIFSICSSQTIYFYTFSRLSSGV